MFYKFGFDHGRTIGKDHASEGFCYWPLPNIPLSVVPRGYLNGYLDGYSQGYRQQKYILQRLELDRQLREDRRQDKEANTDKNKPAERLKQIKTQNHQRTKEQDELER